MSPDQAHVHMNADPMPTADENREHITSSHRRVIPSWANTPYLEYAYHAHLHGIEMPGTPGQPSVAGAQYERNVAELNRILGREQTATVHRATTVPGGPAPHHVHEGRGA